MPPKKPKRPLDPLCASGVHSPFVDEKGKCIRCHKKVSELFIADPLHLFGAFIANAFAAFSDGMRAGQQSQQYSFPPRLVPNTWRQALGFDDNEYPLISEVQKRYHQLARKHHPDRGGDAEKFKIITAARDAALKELRA